MTYYLAADARAVVYLEQRLVGRVLRRRLTLALDLLTENLKRFSCQTPDELHAGRHLEVVLEEADGVAEALVFVPALLNSPDRLPADREVRTIQGQRVNTHNLEQSLMLVRRFLFAIFLLFCHLLGFHVCFSDSRRKQQLRLRR